MKSYCHLSADERYIISTLRAQGFSCREIAEALDRAPSTVSREVRRNAHVTDGRYRAFIAISKAGARRWRSRRGSRFASKEWKIVERLLRQDFSPEQISGILQREGRLSISHETIYRHVWRDRSNGGTLHRHLRGASKKRRKRYRAKDSRGRLAGKRAIDERPQSAETRSRTGHWEIDTVMGSGRGCILTAVDRKTGYVIIGALCDRTIAATNARLLRLMKKYPRRFKTITADNGCEFHGYKDIERATSVTFYFSAPYHSWERGTNENTNGLIRQYLPKGISMDGLSQAQCNAIARKLNHRPRKRHGYRTPAELFELTY